MKIQKPEKQNAALQVLRRITSPSMALAITMALGGAMADTRAANADNLPGMAAQPAEYFYTGKPYDADSGSYTFRYRNYDPEINRWTTADPSGFPDGANNHLYVPNPFSEFDFQGLQVATISDGAWWFSVNYKLSYAENATPSLVGDPWLTGVTNLSGIPAGYEVNIAHGVLQNVQKIDLPDGTWKYTGQLHATIHLSVTFGIKVGPITIGPGYEDSADIISAFEVYE